MIAVVIDSLKEQRCCLKSVPPLAVQAWVWAPSGVVMLSATYPLICALPSLSLSFQYSPNMTMSVCFFFFFSPPPHFVFLFTSLLFLHPCTCLFFFIQINLLPPRFEPPFLPLLPPHFHMGSAPTPALCSPTLTLELHGHTAFWDGPGARRDSD